MIDPVSLAAVLAISFSQDGFVSTGGRDLPARAQQEITRGECDGVPVAVGVRPDHAAIEVSIGDRTRDVTADVFPLQTGPGGREVVRTFVLCRKAQGGLAVHLLFADPRGEALSWEQQGFEVDADLRVVEVGRPLAFDEAAVRRALR